MYSIYQYADELFVQQKQSQRQNLSWSLILILLSLPAKGHIAELSTSLYKLQRQRLLNKRACKITHHLSTAVW